MNKYQRRRRLFDPGHFFSGLTMAAEQSVRGAPPALVVFVLFLSLLFLSPSVIAGTPQRIISLKPNITEILFALGAGDRVVGVTTYCDYPAEAKALPRVADYVKPFTEKIIALSPDLIIGSEENSSRKSVEMLRRMGFDVKLYPFSTIDDTLRSIEAIGTAIGQPERGTAVAQKMRSSLDRAAERVEGVKARRVLVVWGHRPLVIAGRGSFMDELIARIGAINVAGKGSMRYPHWSAENVIAADPEVIIDMGMGSERSRHRGVGGQAGQAMGSDQLWLRLGMVSAVKAERIFTLDNSLFRAGPRLPQALRELTKVIYH